MTIAGIALVRGYYYIGEDRVEDFNHISSFYKTYELIK